MIIINTVPTERNGLTTSVFNYIKNLDMQVDYVSINEPTDPVFRQIITERGGSFYVVPQRLKHPVKYFFALMKILPGQEAMHVHGNSATMAIELLAGFLSGVRMRIAHSHSTRCEYRKADTLLRPLFYLLCTHRLACGQDAGQWLFPNREFTVFNNAIDIESFRFSRGLRDEKRRLLGIDPEETVFLQLANFDPVKNHEFTVDAYAIYKKQNPDKPSRLVFCGGGQRMKSIKARAQQRGLAEGRDIVFAGSVMDTPAWYSAADIFLLPSKYEGMPMTLIEAQSAGLICIVSDNVSRAINYSDRIRFAQLDVDRWAREMAVTFDYDRDRISDEGIVSLRAAGYDIKTEAGRLKRLYTGKE